MLKAINTKLLLAILAAHFGACCLGYFHGHQRQYCIAHRFLYFAAYDAGFFSAKFFCDACHPPAFSGIGDLYPIGK